MHKLCGMSFLMLLLYIFFCALCCQSVRAQSSAGKRRGTAKGSEGQPPQRGRPRGRARTPRPPPQSEQAATEATEASPPPRRTINADTAAQAFPTAQIFNNCTTYPAAVPPRRPEGKGGGAVRRNQASRRSPPPKARGRSARAQRERVDNPLSSAYLKRHLRSMRLTVAVDIWWVRLAFTTASLISPFPLFRLMYTSLNISAFSFSVCRSSVISLCTHIASCTKASRSVFENLRLFLFSNSTKLWYASPSVLGLFR